MTITNYSLLRTGSIICFMLLSFNSFSQEIDNSKLLEWFVDAKYEKIDDYLNKLNTVTKSRNNTDYYYWLCKSNFEKGNFNLAYSLIDSLNANKAYKDFRWLLLSGKIKLAYGQLKESQTYFTLINKLDDLSKSDEIEYIIENSLVYIENENYSKADSFLHKGLQLLTKDRLNLFFKAIIHTHLGESKLEQGNFQEAATHLNIAAEEIIREFDEQHPLLAIIWNHLGRVSLETTNLKEAETYLILAEKIFDENNFIDHPYSWLTQLNIAELHKRSGEFSEAETIFLTILNKSLELYGKNSKTGQIYVELARVNDLVGNTTKAEEYYLQALTSFDKTSKLKKIFNLKHDLASVYWSNNKNKEAQEIYEENLLIAKENIGEHSAQYAVALSGLAVFYDYTGNPNAAEPLYLKARPLIKSIFGEKDEYYTTTIYNLAWLYRMTNRNELAEKFFLEAEEIEKKTIGEYHPDYLITLYGLASFYRKINNPQKAILYYHKANNLQQELITNYYSGFEEATRINYLGKATDNFDLFYSYLTEQHDTRLLIQAQTISLLTKGLALDYSTSNLDAVQTSSDSILHLLLTNFLETKKQLGFAYSLSRDQQTKAGLDLITLKKKAELLEKQLIRRSRVLEQQIAFLGDRRVSSLQDQLSQNEVAIDFVKFNYTTEDKATDTIFYYALLNQNNQGYPTFIQLCEEQQIKKILKISNQYGTGYTKYPEIGQELYKLIWQPLEPYLKDIKTIHLSPTGLLHKIAFGGLPYKAGHLLDEYELNYYGNLRDFINAQPAEIPKSIALAGGAYFDIDSTDLVQLAQEAEEFAFVKADKTDLSKSIASVSRAIASDSTRNAIEFNYLPGTKKEVEQLEIAFKKEGWQTYTYTGVQASEDNIKILNGEKAPGILHLATHGYFFDSFEKGEGIILSDATMRERIIGAESPLLRSGLVFSGVNHSWKGGKSIAGLEDGVLTAFEIANMELWNTELVVLSACETGLGDVESTEGVFGLQRAFKAAGVNKLIISLWKIPDAQTAELMQLFYKNFLMDMLLGDALRAAQLTMSNKYSPFYWAGFVLVE